jgi:uncharacterized protein YbjT (DUF2867 family)
MQNVLDQAPSIKTDNRMVVLAAKDLPVALIDVRDTGAVGARILIDPAPHAGKTFEFTGKLTTYGAFAEVFSQVLGRRPGLYLPKNRRKDVQMDEVSAHVRLDLPSI